MFQKRPKLRDRYTVGIQRGPGGTAVKAFGPDAPAEFEKARAMEAALAGTPYDVPHAIRCDAESGRVEFQYVENAILLQEILEQAYRTRCFRRVVKLNDAAARLLGILHQRLNVPNSRRWQPPAFLVHRASGIAGPSAGADEVFLHGDYSPVNLLVQPDNQITVIDASPNRYFTQYASLKGHRLVDIANYTARLSWPYRLRSHTRTWRKLAATLRRRFVANYQQATGVDIDAGLLQLFETAVVRSFVHWKTESHALRAAASAVECLGRHRRFEGEPFHYPGG